LRPVIRKAPLLRFLFRSAERSHNIVYLQKDGHINSSVNLYYTLYQNV